MKARILVLDTAEQTHNSYIPLAVVDALRRRTDVAFAHLAGYGDAIDLFRREGCDTFLALGGAGCDLAVVGRLCALAKRSAIWLTEDPYELEWNLRVSAPFSLVFTNDLSCLPVYGREGRHLPLAASLLFHDHATVSDEASYLYDLCFVGTAWPNRVETINRVLEGVGRPLRTKIALPINAFLPPVALSDRSLLTDWRVPNPELARVVNRSRITLNLERKFSASRSDQAGGSTPPPRLFENALAGGFQISLGVSAEAKRYFDSHAEVAFCDTDDELIERIAWALDNPDARVAMAQAARTRALNEHLYDHRVDVLLAALAGVDVSNAPSLPPRRKRVLLVTHNVAGKKPAGGIEAYQRELADGADANDVYTLYPLTAEGTTTYTLISHSTGKHHRYGVAHAGEADALHDTAQERIFEQILVENEIDLVHFQHLLGMPLSLPLIAKACGVPTLYTLHDFYLVCSRFNLLDHRGRFCDIARRSPTECDICLGASGIPAGSQQRRHNFIGNVLETFDVLVANSSYTADYLRAVYPAMRPERIKVVEMLTPTSFRMPRPPAAPAVGKAPLRVMVPGNFTHAKGADTIIRVLCALKDEAVDFTILGVVQDPSLEEHLRALSLPRVTIHGGYTPSELPRLMEGVDVSLHLSLWPETYMISLNEAWAAGAVPIVSDLGAPAERVREAIDGFKVDPEDAGRVCDLIRALCDDQERLRAMQQAVKTRTVVTPLEHIAALERIYADLIARSPAPSRPLAFDPRRDFVLSARACGIRTNTPVWTHEGHGWDAAPLHSSSIGKPPHDANVWRTFPGRFAHLPRCEAHQAHVRVERLHGDHRAVEGQSITTKAAIGIGGWAFVPGRGRLLDVILYVQGGSRAVYAVGQPLSRKDVSQHLGEAEAEMSGFAFDLDVSDLQDGPHQVRLLQVYDGVVMDLGVIAEFTVARGQSARAPVLRSGTTFDPNQSPAVRRLAGGVALTRLDALPAGNNGPGFVLEGWAADHAQRRVLPAIHVGFARSGTAPVWFAADRVRAPMDLTAEDPLFTFAGFRVVLPPGALRPGFHRIVVAETDRSESILHETDDAVMLLPDRVVLTSHPVDAEPVAAAPCVAEPPEHRSHLEQVEFDRPGSGLTAGGTHLYLRGWAFVPSFGRAKQLTLQIVGDLRSLQVQLPAMPRWDVAEHHGDEAAWSGFEALVALRDLPAGRYEAKLLYVAARASTALPVDLDLDVAA